MKFTLVSTLNKIMTILKNADRYDNMASVVAKRRRLSFH